MTEHLRPIPLLKEDRTVPTVGDFMRITYPTAGETVTANSTTSRAMVAVRGECGTSKTVTVSMSSQGGGLLGVSTAVPNAGAWTSQGFSLTSGQNCTAYATNGDISDSASFHVR
jgi:hypothetical protein